MGAAKTTSSDLTLKEEKFCRLYATEQEFFGNGTQSYIKAFWPNRKKFSYAAARTLASQLLTKPNVLARINELLDASGLNDAHVDKQLYQVLTQCADFKAKVAAIKEYNSLRGRITEKHQHQFAGVSTEALAERAARIIAGIVSDRGGAGNQEEGK